MEKKPMDYVKAKVIDTKEYGLVLVKEETQLSVEVVMLDNNSRTVRSLGKTDDVDIAVKILESALNVGVESLYSMRPGVIPELSNC